MGWWLGGWVEPCGRFWEVGLDCMLFHVKVFMHADEDFMIAHL